MYKQTVLFFGLISAIHSSADNIAFQLGRAAFFGPIGALLGIPCVTFFMAGTGLAAGALVGLVKGANEGARDGWRQGAQRSSAYRLWMATKYGLIHAPSYRTYYMKKGVECGINWGMPTGAVVGFVFLAALGALHEGAFDEFTAAQ